MKANFGGFRCYAKSQPCVRLKRMLFNYEFNDKGPDSRYNVR